MMCDMNKEERELSAMLVVIASDYVTTYLDEEDWDAGVVALLAYAMETATGRKMKPLEEIWTLRK